MVDIVPLSVFGIILDTIKEFDGKFWIVMITKILTWSNEKRIRELQLDESDFYWALEDYNTSLVKAVVESFTCITVWGVWLKYVEVIYWFKYS